jgi:electron transport complex protein RnfC
MAVETLFEQVQNGQIWPLTGGVHPPSHKAITGNLPIGTIPMPEVLIVPLKQHIGVAGNLLVSEGDIVLKGQPLTEPVKGLSLPVHAPTSGKITKIANHIVAHPSALSEPCVFIEPDGNQMWVERQPMSHFTAETPDYLVEKIKMAGVAGLGGAGFPSFVKSASLRKVNYLIINATECEPYITADDSLIQRSAEIIIQGIDIVSSIINPDRVLIGIEDDKPTAIAALKAAAEHREDIQIRVFPAKYPSGGEKQLISILTGQQVPSSGLPLDIGIVVHNIGTLYAIYNAVICDEPLISRIVTVTGGSINKPQNLEVLIGTPIDNLLDHCGFEPTDKQRVIMGGPMMGFALPSTQVPIVKVSNCILAPAQKELTRPEDEMECIRCSACADACPVKLLPQQLFWYSKAKDHGKAEEYNIKDCIECGACAYVCPSQIPLVQYYRVAKAEIRTEQQEKQLAEKAKVRFEARQVRLDRDAQEREEKQRLASEKRKKALAKTGGKSAVADALARVKAKKAKQAAEAAGGAEPSVEAEKPLTGAALAVAKAKERKRLKEEEQKATQGVTSPVEAIPPTEQTEPAAADNIEQTEEQQKAAEKKARIAATVARAKAKKLAQKEQERLAALDSDTAENGTDSEKPDQ